MDKWICKRSKQCAKMASWYGQAKEQGENRLLDSLNKYGITFVQRTDHASFTQTWWGISDRMVYQCLKVLQDDTDPDVIAEVIDYHHEKKHESITVHGIVRTSPGCYRHIHIALEVNDDNQQIEICTAYDPEDEEEIWTDGFTRRVCFCPKKERRIFYRSIGRDVW